MSNVCLTHASSYATFLKYGLPLGMRYVRRKRKISDCFELQHQDPPVVGLKLGQRRRRRAHNTLKTQNICITFVQRRQSA